MVGDRVAFWLGTANEGTVSISQLWGDTEVVESLFGVQANQSIEKSDLQHRKSLDLLHPFDSLQSTDEEDRRLRERWVQDIAGGEFRSPLVQEYPVLPQAAKTATHETLTAAIVTEAISACSATEEVDGPSITLSGCLFVHQSGAMSNEGILGDACSALHRVNNKLSVATMSLDLISLRLQSLPSGTVIDEIGESSESVRKTLMSCGKMIREKLSQWSR